MNKITSDLLQLLPCPCERPACELWKCEFLIAWHELVKGSDDHDTTIAACHTHDYVDYLLLLLEAPL